ncbi:MAG: Holliday junction branch migration protein RuvA [Candidatus Gastranaerophilaceae bacterium]|jgi:holliday junction DNA helicase ruvA|uniref:Holliday junction branch migration complex subunit RuvA n=1 Tax=Candidatus Limenecus avicola TaxID=2840847 RepID=A0A9D1N1E2_9CLOT|nr:Holliday junction branch migration protein RuvA [Candidatus Limenecus avicola]
MYDYIKGKLVSKQPASSKGAAIVVDNNNMGYLIHTTNRNIALAKEEGSDIKVYTSLIHREDAMILCGFLNREDRDIFNILLSVSGVGMKVALVLLDEFSGYDLISAVIRGDFKELSRAKGVGPKLAQKIILELKDKLINWQKSSPVDVSDISSTQKEMSEESLSEAQAVLLSLGYSVAEAKGAIKMACQSVTKSDSSEEILKEALRYLAME